MNRLLAKYNQVAESFAERSYANLGFYMHRRFIVATSWGYPLRSGDSVLELGCGDGYLAQLFVQQGFHYRGVDIAPNMVAMARRRLSETASNTQLMVADVGQMSLSEPCDAVLSYMRAFFTYIDDPETVLKRFRPYIRKKIILDLNPRGSIPLQTAIEMLEKAGFRHIAWRPFFVPKEKRLPRSLLKVLVACESLPLLRSFPLRWKFHVLLKGETEESRL